MTIDQKVREAIEQATKESEQSDALARKLIAWVEAVASGNEELYDNASAHRHLEVILAEINLPETDGDSE
jgi:hypothetical protein